MEIQITYENRNLVIQGHVVGADPDSGMSEDYFVVYEMKCNDIDVLNDYGFDEECEISAICLKESKEIDGQNHLDTLM